MIDRWFVQDINSSGISSTLACIGRSPAWDSASLSIMADKIIDYGHDSTSSWCDRAICLSDCNAADGSLFEVHYRGIRKYISSLWPDTISVGIRASSPDHLEPGDFVSLWDHGAGLVTYFGHASPINLSVSHYFLASSINSSTNDHRLPICLLGGCDLTFDARQPVSIPTFWNIRAAMKLQSRHVKDSLMNIRP